MKNCDEVVMEEEMEMWMWMGKDMRTRCRRDTWLRKMLDVVEG